VRVAIISGAPREWLTALDLGDRHFDYTRSAPRHEYIDIVVAKPLTPLALGDIQIQESVMTCSTMRLRWHRFGLQSTARMWGLATARMWGLELIDADPEFSHLLNVAYTCRPKHVDAEAARRVRETFERALGVTG
jgi:hypothetical protein